MTPERKKYTIYLRNRGYKVTNTKIAIAFTKDDQTFEAAISKDDPETVHICAVDPDPGHYISTLIPNYFEIKVPFKELEAVVKAMKYDYEKLKAKEEKNTK